MTCNHFSATLHSWRRCSWRVRAGAGSAGCPLAWGSLGFLMQRAEPVPTSGGTVGDHIEAQIKDAFATASADSLPGRMGIKILEVFGPSGSCPRCRCWQHAALRPAARRRLVRSRRYARLAGLGSARGPGTASRLAFRLTPPITVSLPRRSHRAATLLHGGRTLTRRRDRHHRRAGPPRLDEPADLPAPRRRTRRRQAAHQAPRTAPLVRDRPATGRPGNAPRQGIAAAASARPPAADAPWPAGPIRLAC